MSKKRKKQGWKRAFKFALALTVTLVVALLIFKAGLGIGIGIGRQVIIPPRLDQAELLVLEYGQYRTDF